MRVTNPPFPVALCEARVPPPGEADRARAGNSEKTAYLAVLNRADGSCRAVGEFDVKNRDVAAAAQPPAGQSVTPALLQRRHAACRSPLPGRQRSEQMPHKQTNIGERDPERGRRPRVAAPQPRAILEPLALRHDGRTQGKILLARRRK